MTQDWSDTGSIAGRFVDVDGVRRGCMDKAALVIPSNSDLHLNAGEKTAQSLLPEVDGMSHSRQSSNAEAEKRAYPNQRSLPTEEEYRLLGGSIKDDPEAVSIAKPATRHSGMIGKVIPGGPQPRNTLSRLSFTPGAAGSRKATPRPRGRGRPQHALAVEVHKGSNVNSFSNPHEGYETLPTPPSAKRRKLDCQASPASSDQTDPLDQISPHAMSFHTSQDTKEAPIQALSTSTTSQISGHQLKRHGSFEYRKVERMMDSNPKSKKQRHNENRNYPADHILLPSSPQKRSSISNPIDISGEESQTNNNNSTETLRPAYRGTARQPPPTSNGIKSNTSESLNERARPTQSPYFDKTRLAANKANGNAKQKLNSRPFGREDSPGLAHKFVAADGRRRGSDVNASSDADELQSAPTTVGQNADPDAVFTVKEMRSNSPSKHSSSTLKASTPSDDLATYAPSTIKSDFPISNPRSQTSGRPTQSAPRDQEAKPPWSVALAAISFPGWLYKDDDLGLVHDHKQKEYYIQRQGSTIKSSHSTLRIRPQKLVKVLWENLGKRVRLESSRSGTEDNVLDLEFKLERDVSALLQKLQDSKPFTVIGKSSEHMQKIFEKRRSELGSLYKDYGPEEIMIVTESRQRNDSSKSLAPLDDEKASRQRHKPSIVDKLVLSPTHDSDVTASQPKTSMPAMPNGLPQGRRIKEILAKVRPVHDEHLDLRRSTRSSAFHDGESVLASIDGVPEREKYSVKHGLGDPWKKPLTYPKVGKKKTTVEWSDLERLDEGEFLNDNLISFYLRYLEQRLEEERPELAKRVYFFNTFFFATLTSAHKGKKRFNYEGVQKWTRSVDLFTYDYIIVPINGQAHWYLAIICNLPALDRDLAMPEERASSPIEDGGTTSRREPSQPGEPELNPTAQLSDIVEPTAKEPNERETRTSFSQLTLENNERSSAGHGIDTHEHEATEKASPNSEDKEMLDSQIEDTMAEFAAPKEAEDLSAPTREHRYEIEDPIEEQDEGHKAAAKSRKSKRKSAPAPITKIDPRKPAIITFDSLGQSRATTIRILKDYLREEARAKRGMEYEDSQIKGINAKRIPQQDNFSDCGVFLLGYVDTFLGLETDPKDFITKTIQQTHEEKDWSKLVPGNLRASIRDQVRELHEIQKNERREDSAKQSGKVPERDGQKKLEPSPSRASDQAEILRKQPVKTTSADQVPATEGKSPEPSLLDKAQAKVETLESTRRRDVEDFEKSHDPLEELLRKSEQEMLKGAEYQRLFNSDDTEFGMNEGASAVPPEDPSVIMVDSQSQRTVSAPTGVVYPPSSSEKQNCPESTSSMILNPAPFSFNKERSPELPSEIPDSQNSNPSGKTEKTLDKSNVVAANADPVPVAADFTLISDSNRGWPDPQGERNERFKRRKTGREDRAEVQEAPETHDMIFTIEHRPERREEHKEPSKRRKKSSKEASKDLEEVQVHVIDD